jgi:hypothetical protein
MALKSMPNKHQSPKKHFSLTIEQEEEEIWQCKWHLQPGK